MLHNDAVVETSNHCSIRNCSKPLTKIGNINNNNNNGSNKRISSGLVHISLSLHVPNSTNPRLCVHCISFPMSGRSGVDLPCLIALIPICRKFSVFAAVLAACIFKYWLTMPPLHTWAMLQFTSQKWQPVITDAGWLPACPVCGAPGLLWTPRAQSPGLPSLCSAPVCSTTVQPEEEPILQLWQDPSIWVQTKWIPLSQLDSNISILPFCVLWWNFFPSCRNSEDLVILGLSFCKP